MKNIYDFFRYYLPLFFKNIWRFKKELLHFSSFDFIFNLKLFKRSLEITKECLIHGHEIEETLIPKVKKLQETIDTINYFINSEYFDELDKQGLKFPKMWTEQINETFSEVKFEEDKDNYIKKSNQLEEKSWHKIWKLIDENMRGWWD